MNAIAFKSWPEVLASAKRGEALFYQAPLDRFPVTLTPANGSPGPYRYEARARTIRIYPPGCFGRGKLRTSDPFSADAGHLSRFSYMPSEAT